LFVLLLSVSCGMVLAQGPSKLNFQLRAWLAQAPPTEQVDLFLSGDPDVLARVVEDVGGRVKMAIPGWLLASMAASDVAMLDKNPAVGSIVFSLSKGQVLNDSMRVKAHVNEAHLGLPPLPAPYTGKGVIMGIIDTGMDFTHPDFLDSLGHTRVLRYWDQNFPYDQWLTPSGFGYGQAWDSTAINAGNCPATDPMNQYGHGTTVAATAAAKDKPSGRFSGVAPDADFIIVANDLEHPNWNASVVDAVRYIVEQAAALGRPVAINLSLGDYFGSHDGLDPAALMINQMLTAAPGRVLVCAAGNSGALPAYHLHTEVTADTSFTWFKYNPNSVLNLGAVYFELWADTADLNQVQYSIGANKASGSYAFRGRIPFRNIQGTLGQIVMDTLWSTDGNKLGRVFTQADTRDGQYHLEVYIPEPDSAGQLNYSFLTTGTGRFDVWSSDVFGTSKIEGAVPDSASYPAIVHYVAPDTLQSIVDSWACSPQVITVANYANQQQYVDATGVARNLGGVPGQLRPSSSHGPTRTGSLKPDVAAPGDVTFGAGPLALLPLLLQNSPEKLIDSLHMRNGGTSIASPVVAGTAALLLEKCPRASNTMVRDAIISSAFGDTFTGALPNLGYGHGKVNAFAALVATNVQVPLSGGSTVCPGDSVLISGPDFMYSYLWNTGWTQRDTWTSGDTLVLSVQTPQGCSGTSDTLIVSPLPSPSASITADGLLLTSTPAAAFQWFLDSLPIAGADGQSWQAESNGSYFVRVTDSLGCTGYSDTILITTVGLEDLPALACAIWPVPVKDQMHITGLEPGRGNVHFGILDAQGRIVGQGTLAGGSAVIQVGALSSGPYVLRLEGLRAPVLLRFIKD
jgi:hypothetical protein